MNTLVNQDLAKKYMLQTSERDVNIVIPFNSDSLGLSRFTGNSPAELNKFNQTITALDAGGGTDIYSPLNKAVEIVNKEPNINQYFAAVILMTDGKSNENKFDQLVLNADLPVYAIMFGDADESQLKPITDKFGGRIFDGRKDLVSAFRTAKGYN
jgi:Ca-activated chloride channel family protein